MDNILYKAFGKRIYKALLNLVGGGSGSGNTSGDVKTLAFDINGNFDPLVLRISDSAIFTSIAQEVIDSLIDNPEVLNTIKECVARNKLISDFIVECINNNKIPQVYFRKHDQKDNYAILSYLTTLFEAIRYNDLGCEGIALIDKSNNSLYGIISGTYEGDKFVASDVPFTTGDMG